MATHNPLRRYASIGLMLLLALPTFVPTATATPDERDGPLLADLPLEGLVPTERLRTPEDFLRAAGDVRDPGFGPAVVRAFLEQQGVPVPDPRDADVSVSSHFGGVIRFGLPVGDLTGDGLDDALSYELDFADFSFAVRGVSGLTGEELWSRDFGPEVYDVLPVPAGDLTGDGADDVLLLTFTFDQAVGAVAVVSYWYHWDLSVVDGATGLDVWFARYAGQLTGAFGCALLACGFRYEATKIAVLPFLSGDHDGDGLDDVVVNVLDARVTLAFAFALVAFAEVIDIQIATRAEVLAGDTAQRLLLRAHNYVPNGVLLLPAGDAVGDAAPDLLWERIADVQGPIVCGILVGCRVPFRSDLVLEMIDGNGFVTAWETRVEGLLFGAAEALGGDADGDGKGDLALYAAPDESTFEQGVVAGATGEVLWLRPFDPYTLLFVAGPIGGAAGDDLVAAPVFGFVEAEGSLPIERVDGATGASLFSTALDLTGHPEIDHWFTFAYEFGDADADGVTDLGLIAEGHDHDDPDFPESGLVFANVVESSASGARLLERVTAGLEFGLPAGDVNGDGADDAYLLAISFQPSALLVDLSALDVAGGAALWTRSDAYSGLAFLALEPTGDQTGAGGADALYSRAQNEQSGLKSRIDGLDGQSGALSWGFGDALTPPDGGGGGAPQNDAGTGGDAANSAPDATAVAPGSYTGALGEGDTNDFYSVGVGGDLLTATVAPLDPASGQAYHVALLDANGRVLDEAALGADAVTLQATGDTVLLWVQWSGVAVGGGPPEYGFALERGPLPAHDAYAVSGRLACKAGALDCSADNENADSTFPVAATPTLTVVHLRYAPTNPANKVTVEVWANGVQRAILQATDHRIEVSGETAASWWAGGGEVRLVARAPKLGLGPVPFGVAVDQPFEVCAAFFYDAEPHGYDCGG